MCGATSEPRASTCTHVYASSKERLAVGCVGCESKKAEQGKTKKKEQASISIHVVRLSSNPNFRLRDADPGVEASDDTAPAVAARPILKSLKSRPPPCLPLWPSLSLALLYKTLTSHLLIHPITDSFTYC